VLLGESAVGKSSLVLRFVKKQFFEYQESTIGGVCARRVPTPRGRAVASLSSRAPRTAPPRSRLPHPNCGRRWGHGQV
jgi:hypothetical protein